MHFVLLHLLKRDLRRTWRRWLGLLLTSGLITAFPHLVFGRGGDSADFFRLNTALVLLTSAHFALVFWLVHTAVTEDSPRRETAHWRTRPIEPTAVWLSRLLYIGVFLWLAPLGIAWMGGVGLSRDEILSGLVRALWFHSVPVVVATTAAMLARRMWLGLTVVVGGFVLLTVCGLWRYFENRVFIAETSNPQEYALWATRWKVAGMLIGGALTWATWDSYARRRARGLVVLAGTAGVAWAVLTTDLWRWRWLPEEWTAPRPRRAELWPAAAAELDLDELELGYDPDSGQFGITGTLRREPRDDCFWRLMRVEPSAAQAYPKLDPAPYRSPQFLGRGPGWSEAVMARERKNGLKLQNILSNELAWVCEPGTGLSLWLSPYTEKPPEKWQVDSFLKCGSCAN